jgi:hypothetical protein
MALPDWRGHSCFAGFLIISLVIRILLSKIEEEDL